MTEVTAKVELKPCPYCGIAINRIESWARAFQPAVLFHEYHHACPGQCFIRTRILWSGEAGTDDETRFIAAWNQRDLRPDDALRAEISEAITLIDRHIWQASEPIVDLLKRLATLNERNPT